MKITVKMHGLSSAGDIDVSDCFSVEFGEGEDRIRIMAEGDRVVFMGGQSVVVWPMSSNCLSVKVRDD